MTSCSFSDQLSKIRFVSAVVNQHMLLKWARLQRTGLGNICTYIHVVRLVPKAASEGSRMWRVTLSTSRS
jgi:hypothetical protein